jgi:hypothetical protein
MVAVVVVVVVAMVVVVVVVVVDHRICGFLKRFFCKE